MAKTLTNDRAIRNLKPDDKRYKVAVASPHGGGLSLYVFPSGKKTFVFRYRFADKADEVRLGSYPSLSLAQAREAHGEAVRNLNEGRNPKLVRKQQVESNRTARTCDELFKDWIEHYAQVPSTRTGRVPAPKTVKQNAGRWRLYCEPIKKVLVEDVDKPTLVRMLTRLARTKPVEARHTLNLLRMMLRYAESLGEIPANPAETISARSIHGSQGRIGSRYLSLEELKQLWEVLESPDAPANPETVLAIQLIILTGCRVSEVTGAARSEFDLTRKLWKIPPERTKNRLGHTVYLSDMALQVIEKALIISESDYVFESYIKRGHPVRADSIDTVACRLLGVQRKDEPRDPEAPLADMEYFKPHDLRRTFSTLQAELLGTEQSVIDRMLNHRPAGRLQQTYQHAKQAERQREAWERFGKMMEDSGLCVSPLP